MDEQHTATISTTRLRSVQESVAANRQHRKVGSRIRRYTKRHAYDGFQSVLDSQQKMAELEQHRKPPDVPTFSISSTELDDDDDLPPGAVGAAVGDESQVHHVVDPVMREINDMQENCQNVSSMSSTSSWNPGPKLFQQPQNQPMTTEQLIQEVKGIYRGLALIERKCIETVQKQTLASGDFNEVQWRSVMFMHRTLLSQYHDFFTATQHPASPSMLKSLAQRYMMPDRMWWNAMHAILQMLHYRGGPSLVGEMTSFVHFARSMLEELAEDVPSMTDDWNEVGRALDSFVECLSKDIAHPEPYRPELYTILQSDWAGHQKWPMASDGSSSRAQSSFDFGTAYERPLAKRMTVNEILTAQLSEQFQPNDSYVDQGECRLQGSPVSLAAFGHAHNSRLLGEEISCSQVVEYWNRFTTDLRLPERDALTLDAWLNYGQAITSKRIYAKVFCFLGLVGKYGRNWRNKHFEAMLWRSWCNSFCANIRRCL